jgi:hypothetical protein
LKSRKARVKALDKILRDGDYAFALDRHKAISECLKLPWRFACMGYSYVEQGSLAKGVKASELKQVK